MSFNFIQILGGPNNITSATPLNPALIGGGANSNSGSGMVGSGERSLNRKVLRSAFGNSYNDKLKDSALHYNKGNTPFRLAFTAGDVKTSDGESTFAGNPKYVYDSSDYMKYRKLRAVNKNYYDYSFGGDKHNSTQSALNIARA